MRGTRGVREGCMRGAWGVHKGVHKGHVGAQSKDNTVGDARHKPHAQAKEHAKPDPKQKHQCGIIKVRMKISKQRQRA